MASHFRLVHPVRRIYGQENDNFEIILAEIIFAGNAADWGESGRFELVDAEYTFLGGVFSFRCLPGRRHVMVPQTIDFERKIAIWHDGQMQSIWCDHED